MTTNKQIWILTTYGKNRINQVAQSRTTDRLYITKIKVGTAPYYIPTQGVNDDIKTPIIKDGQEVYFNINEKSVEDTTVTFSAIIDETSGGYDITEIGLYETVNGTDYCFALGTCETLHKPEYGTDNGYVMSINYKLHINSVNLADVYDLIELDASNEYVTKEELEALSRTVLFVEGNLMDQISVNTHILGLNRAQQLSELVDETRTAYSNASLTNLYTNLLNTTDVNNIRGFWGFGHTEKYDSLIAIKDFSLYGNNLSLNKPIAEFETGNHKIIPYVNFDGTDYYYAGQNTSLIMSNSFTMFFAGEINTINTNKVLLAQARPDDTPFNSNWIIKINSSNALEITVYMSASQYKVYTSAIDLFNLTSFALAITYDNGTVKAYLNNTEITLTETEYGTWTQFVLATNNVETSSYLISQSGTTTSRNSYVDSKISFISLLNTTLSSSVIRAVNLSLMALMGKNIYRGN